MPHKRIAKQQHPVLPFVGCCLSLFLLLLLLNPFLRVFHVLALGLAVPIHRCRSPSSCLLLPSTAFKRSSTTSNVFVTVSSLYEPLSNSPPSSTLSCTACTWGPPFPRSGLALRSSHTPDTQENRFSSRPFVFLSSNQGC